MAWPALNDFNDIKLDSNDKSRETAAVVLYILNTAAYMTGLDRRLKFKVGIS